MYASILCAIYAMRMACHYQQVYRLQFKVRLLLLRPNEIIMMVQSHQ